MLCRTEIWTREFFIRVFLFFKEVAAVFYSKNFNYGQGAYPANQKCNWTIEATSNDEHIVLLFADYFGLEGGGRYCTSHTVWVILHDSIIGILNEPQKLNIWILFINLKRVNSDVPMITLQFMMVVIKMPSSSDDIAEFWDHHRLFHPKDHSLSNFIPIRVFKVKVF